MLDLIKVSQVQSLPFDDMDESTRGDINFVRLTIRSSTATAMNEFVSSIELVENTVSSPTLGIPIASRTRGQVEA